MIRLSRLGLAAAFAVILAAAPTARAADPDPLLPAESDTVYYLNVKQLIGSDVVKKYALEQIKQFLAGQEAKQLLEEMGLDPLKDIETIWGGSFGKDQTDTQALIVVHGKFDPEKLFKAAEAASKKDNAKISLIKDGNATLFKFQPDQGNPLYGTVVDEKTVIAGTDKKIVADGLKRAEDKKKTPIGAELAAMVKKMDDKSSIYTVSIVKGKFKDLKLPAQLPIDLTALEKALPNTNTISVVMKVATDINLEVIFGMKDEDSATDMGDAVVGLVDGLKGLVPLLAAAEPRAKPLVDVVKTIKSDVKKKDVTITGKITGADIGKMINPDG